MSTFAVPDQLAEAWAVLFARYRQFSAFVLDAPLPMKLAPVGTACTDGKSIMCDLKFFNGLDYEQQSFVVGHEIVHVWYRHPAILKAWMDAGEVAGLPFDMDTAQQAMDCIVNDTLFKFGFPLNAFPKQGTYRPDLIDWMCGEEEAYARLYQQQPPPPQDGDGQDEDEDEDGGQGQSGQGPKQPDDQGEQDADQGTEPGSVPPKKPGKGYGQPKGAGDMPGGGVQDVIPSDGKDEMGQARQDMVLRRLLQGVDPSSLRGVGKGEYERFVERLAPTHMDWRSAVDRRLRAAFGKGKWSWERPRARALSMGTVLPGKTGKRAGTLLVACDTSGSIGDDECQMFLAGCWELIQQTRPKVLLLMEVDDGVQRVREIRNAAEFRDVVIKRDGAKLLGGGGTDLRKIFHWVEANRVKPEQILVFSDLQTPFPETVPCKTLWVSTTPGLKAPVGDTVGFKRPTR